LDPPRKGTAPGVIRELASRRPERVLHVFCGTDEIPRELYQWKSAGYVLRTLQPLDMFPGTPHLETFCLLEYR
jgi:tRNA/tmRNA/rRNA uracil-C5-methylase (TrmA/RlmC/RlmD family)